MDYQSVVEKVGIGLAHQVMEDSLSGFQFDTLRFGQERDLYEAERDYDKQTQILERMFPKAASARELLYLLWEARFQGREALRDKIFEKLMALDLGVGMLKKVYEKAHGDDDRKNVVARKIRATAKTVEHLNEAYRRVLCKSTQVENDDHCSSHLEYRDEDQTAHWNEKMDILAQMVELTKEQPWANHFRILFYEVKHERDKKLADALFDTFREAKLSFGELYQLFEACDYRNRFYDNIVERLRQMSPSLGDILMVFDTHSIGIGMEELMAEKVSTGNYDPSTLAAIYRASRRQWDKVDDAIVERVRTLVGDGV